MFCICRRVKTDDQDQECWACPLFFYVFIEWIPQARVGALTTEEENEVDIINDQITRETLIRQESIMSRLLEAEKAQRERDQDKKRQSTEWMDKLSKRLINPFEDYQKEKEKQEELLRTIPPSFTPFYKNKVKDYFKENGN